MQVASRLKCRWLLWESLSGVLSVSESFSVFLRRQWRSPPTGGVPHPEAGGRRGPWRWLSTLTTAPWAEQTAESGCAGLAGLNPPLGYQQRDASVLSFFPSGSFYI